MGAETVAIALGANLGDPAATLLEVRPLVEEVVRHWWGPPGPRRLLWSPLFETAPVGGPPNQPAYLNAALLVKGTAGGAPSISPPGLLLLRLLALEARFGRLRRERWGPRSLDLDLLWCGSLRQRTQELELPHPRLAERTFVLAPLAAIDPSLPIPGPHRPTAGAAAIGPRGDDPIQVLGDDPSSPIPVAMVSGMPTCGELLAALLPGSPEPPPRRLPPRPGWPE